MNKSVKSGEFEICIQWFQPDRAQESAKLVGTESTSTPQKALFLLFAMNNKAVDLATNPVSAQVKAGLCRVEGSRVQALHEKLMAMLETAESDLVPVQTTQAAVGTTEQNKCEFQEETFSAIQHA